MKVISQIISELDSLMSRVPGQNEKQSENLKYLRKIADSCRESVKVVIMGEVKAGKSTLINSILQRKLSCTDVAETTALLHQFVYSEESYGRLYRKDGSSQKGTVEEVKAFIERSLTNKNLIKSCEAVEFGLPIPILKRFDLVDTPGLGTVTKENEKRTLEYISQADIILWVFNSHYIGQSNIREAVMKVMKQGKQVIGILNRMDEVDLTEKELLSSARRWIPFIEKYYPLSAYEALEKAVTGETGSSSLSKLLEEVEGSIGEEKQKAKKKAVTLSLWSLIERESAWQKQKRAMAGEIRQKLKGHQQKLQEAHQELSEEAYRNYLNWLEHDFMLNEFDELHKAKANKGELLRLQEVYFKESYINGYMADKVIQISDSLKERWVHKAKSIDGDLVQEIREYIKNEAEARLQVHITLNEAEGMFSNEEEGLTDDFVKGATVGTVIASLAFLGPAATQITFIGMASSILPVALIGGLVATLYKKNKIKHADLRECQEVYKEMKKSMMYLRDQLLEEAEMANPFEDLSRQIMEQLVETVLHHLNIQDQLQLGRMNQEIEAYEEKLSALKERLMANERKEAEPEQIIEIDQDLLDLLR